MKKALLILVALAMGCASSPVVKKDICDELRDRMPGKAQVLMSEEELNQYMYWKGAELAVVMKKGITPACVEAHIYMNYNGIESYGEVCAEKREDGLYFIETSCDYKGGEEIKRRDKLERKLGE
jgi:hypothetical protein